MRAIQLDFLQPAGRGSRLAPYLLIAGVIAASAAVSYQRQVGQQVVARESQINELRGMANRTLPALAERETDTPEVRNQIKKANSVLQQMNIPWGDLFSAVESAENGDVALLAVQPDPRTHTISIGGEARSLPAVLSYMGRLERTSRLREVVLASHEMKIKEPGQPVTFTIAAIWEEAR